MRRGFHRENTYLNWGLTAFLVIAACILFYFLLKVLPIFAIVIKKIAKILSPFIWGLIITYLLAPLMRRLEKKMPRWLAVVICLLLLLLILTALVYLILPQLYDSLETMVVSSPEYFDRAMAWIQKTLGRNPGIEQYVTGAASSLSERVTDLITTHLLPSLGSVVSNVTTGVYYVVLGVYNLIVGIIVSAYLLGKLDRVKAGARKLLYSIFSIEAAARIQSGIHFVDVTFMSFISGKLLDSAIIGLLCYIFCAIVKMPYALLVSVIVGVTNIIPFFGPFIGAIPSALIILLINPIKALIFVVFIIILQQLDGNFIGPKILGSSIGINGFWVMFSIILGAGLFGFWGMLLGVPVWVCLYTGFQRLVDRKLRRSNLPTDPAAYVHLDHIDAVTGEIVEKE